MKDRLANFIRRYPLSLLALGALAASTLWWVHSAAHTDSLNLKGPPGSVQIHSGASLLHVALKKTSPTYTVPTDWETSASHRELKEPIYRLNTRCRNFSHSDRHIRLILPTWIFPAICGFGGGIGFFLDRRRFRRVTPKRRRRLEVPSGTPVLVRMAAIAVFLIAGFSATARAELKAGAATSNITPKMGVPLDGTIMQIGPAKHVHDELHARCLVLDDGKTRLAFVVVDNTMVSKAVYDQAKAEIEKHTGVPADHICISATHSHSTPRAVVGLVDNDLHREYLEFLASRIADGVRRAINNLQPAEIGWGSFQEPRYVHNRRWFVQEHIQSKLKNIFGESGEKVRMNPGREGLDKPAGPVDTEVFVLSVRHTDGRPLALMGNYGLHYIGGIPGGTVSADYFGVFADRTQELLKADRLQPPFVGIMSNGTSGDVNANDMSIPRQKFKLYERMTTVGNDLAAGAATVAESAEYRGGKDISLAAVSINLDLKVRKLSAKRIAWAEKMKASPDHQGPLKRPQVYAREIQFLKDYPDTVSVPIQVFRIGDLAVAQVPCETFAETGLAIKRDSPFKPATFTIELANGFFGYLPPPEHFDWGGYETWPARSSFLEEQAEVKIREAVSELMEDLKAR